MTVSNRIPNPPDELAESGRQLWNWALSEFEFDVHELLLLRQACRVADTLDRLSAAAQDAPLTVRNARGDMTSNPILVESRQQGIVLARILAALGLPSGSEERRPQRRDGARGVRGVYKVRKYGSANPVVRDLA